MKKFSALFFVLATVVQTGGLSAAVTGDGRGLLLDGVVCRNLTTGQLVVTTSSGTAWDCGVLGLVFSQGDRVETGLRGTVPVEMGALAFEVRQPSLPEDFSPQPISDDGSGDFLLGDLDGDGDLDVVDEGGIFKWHENLGGPTPVFVPHLLNHLISFISDAVSNAQLLDVNGDGRLDIVASNFFSATTAQLSVFQNEGGTPPTFSRVDVSTEFPWDLEIGRGVDVDGDGDMDFFALRFEKNCGSCTNELVWLESVGNDVYEKHVITTNKNGDIEPVDVDLDGDPDVISASGLSLTWFENDGASFATEHVIPSTESVFTVQSADLDGDGDVDLISPTSDEVVSWHENTGNGSFIEHLLHTFPGNPAQSRVSLADYSGDGLLDVVLASDVEPTWLENLGGSPPSFRANSLVSVFNGDLTTIGSTSGDVDEDGRADFVASKRGDTEGLDWYRNQIGRRLVVGGMSVRGFFCRNRTTGQTVRVPTTDTAIDCENEGLIVNPGDQIEVFARGQAE